MNIRAGSAMTHGPELSDREFKIMVSDVSKARMEKGDNMHYGMRWQGGGKRKQESDGNSQKENRIEREE